MLQERTHIAQPLALALLSQETLGDVPPNHDPSCVTLAPLRLCSSGDPARRRVAAASPVRYPNLIFPVTPPQGRSGILSSPQARRARRSLPAVERTCILGATVYLPGKWVALVGVQVYVKDRSGLLCFLFRTQQRHIVPSTEPLAPPGWRGSPQAMEYASLCYGNLLQQCQLSFLNESRSRQHCPTSCRDERNTICAGPGRLPRSVEFFDCTAATEPGERPSNPKCDARFTPPPRPLKRYSASPRAVGGLQWNHPVAAFQFPARLSHSKRRRTGKQYVAVRLAFSGQPYVCCGWFRRYATTATGRLLADAKVAPPKPTARS